MPKGFTSCSSVPSMGAAGHEALSSLYSKITSTKGDMEDVTWMVVSNSRCR